MKGENHMISTKQILTAYNKKRIVLDLDVVQKKQLYSEIANFKTKQVPNFKRTQANRHLGYDPNVEYYTVVYDDSPSNLSE
tara:strand:- start:590 stop:832 length:243 start_codon:yes stop_codon:yes gene_type:complete